MGSRQDARALAALVVRVVLGWIFAAAGWWKVFSLGATQHARTLFVEPYADTLLPAWSLWIAGTTVPFVELGGGALLLFGWRRLPAAAGLGGVLILVTFGHLLTRSALRFLRPRGPTHAAPGPPARAPRRRPLEPRRLVGAAPLPRIPARVMSATPSDFAWRVRGRLFRTIRERSATPTPSRLASGLRAPLERVTRALEALAAAHVLVLDSAGSVLMAHPFAGARTGFRVETPSGSYWANCAWDALAIPLLLGTDGVTPTRCPGTGEAFDLAVRAGRVGPAGAVVRFPVPARRFWDDIHFT